MPPIFHKRSIPISMKLASLILVGLPAAQILEDICIIEIGPLFITPLKVVLLFGGLILIKYTYPVFMGSPKIASPILFLFILFVMLQTVTIFFADSLETSRKVNYVFYNIATLVIVYSLSRVMIKSNYLYYFQKFSTVINQIFFLSLFFATAQFLMKDQIIRDIGNFPHIWEENVMGLNVERLFLCEFLTLGLAFILLNKSTHFSIKILLSIWVFILIYVTNSFTGLLSFGLILFAFPKLKLKYLLLILLLLSSFYHLILPSLRADFSEIVINRRKYRYESYFQNFETSNWRYRSTIAILSEVIRNPTLLGNGFRENENFLSKAWSRYRFDKHGASNAAPGQSHVAPRRMSTHTFFSILYDQGILGFLIFLTMVSFSIIYCFKFGTLRPINQYSFTFFRITIIMSGLVIHRFLFYYHSINRWHFIVTIIFLNTGYFLFKNRGQVSVVVGGNELQHR
jgi:hypothetical protein